MPYKADSAEIDRRRLDSNGRRNTEAGFGRDRRKTYEKGGADPGNVIEACQTYNQHRGPAGQHTAVMPEGLAEFFVKAACPREGLVIDPFAGSGTTIVVARRHQRRGAGIELHRDYVNVSRDRIASDEADDAQGRLSVAV